MEWLIRPLLYHGFERFKLIIMRSQLVDATSSQFPRAQYTSDFFLLLVFVLGLYVDCWLIRPGAVVRRTVENILKRVLLLPPNHQNWGSLFDNYN